MPKVDNTKEAEAMKKLAEAAKELAEINNKKPLTKEQAEELSKRAT